MEGKRYLDGVIKMETLYKQGTPVEDIKEYFLMEESSKDHTYWDYLDGLEEGMKLFDCKYKDNYTKLHHLIELHDQAVRRGLQECLGDKYAIILERHQKGLEINTLRCNRYHDGIIDWFHLEKPIMRSVPPSFDVGGDDSVAYFEGQVLFLDM